jgi:hypothetical protein
MFTYRDHDEPSELNQSATSTVSENSTAEATEKVAAAAVTSKKEPKKTK